MRKDISTDRKQVSCKNSSTLGFSCKTLYCGEKFIFVDESSDDQKRLGRMVARISACSSPDHANVTGRIIAVVLTEELGLCERWVRPEDVIRTFHDQRGYDKSLETVTEFLTMDAKAYEVNKVRAFVESGFSTMKKFDARHGSTHLAVY